MPVLEFGPAEARRFLRLCFGIAAALVVSAVSINGWALFVTGDIDGVGFVPRQRAKASALGRTDIVLLGDSSLGNAIDTAMFARITGLETGNLALNGLFGFMGDLRMLEAIAADRLPPRILLMHTSDMLTRPPADLGGIAAASGLGLDPGSPRSGPELVAAMHYVWMVPSLAVIRSLLAPGDGGVMAEHGYVRQARRSLQPVPDRARLRPEDIRPDKVDELKRLARWCSERGVEVWYVHGPLDVSVLAASGPYYEAVSRILGEVGVRLVAPLPLGLHPEAIGDSEDHVDGAFLPAATEWYAHRVVAALRGEAEPTAAVPPTVGNPDMPYGGLGGVTPSRDPVR